MNRHSLHTPTLWLVVIAVVLLTAHAVLVCYASTHLALSTAVITGLVILVVIKHVGLLGTLHGLMRRRSRRSNK